MCTRKCFGPKIHDVENCGNIKMTNLMISADHQVLLWQGNHGSCVAWMGRQKNLDCWL
jgi:hypothetical protein